MDLHESLRRADLALRTYRSVEPVLRDLIQSWPTPTTLSVPSHLAIETFTRRIRSGAQALLRFRWPYVSINPSTFAPLWSQVTISVQDRTLTLGPRPTPMSLARKNFNAVESILFDFVQAWPTPVSISVPAGRSPHTIANRIRNGIRDVLHARWSDVSIDLTTLATLWSQAVVSVRGETVTVGPKDSTDEPTVLAANSSVGGKVGLTISPVQTTPATIDAVLHLHHIGVLTDPTHFVLLPEATRLEQRIEHENLNAALAPSPDGKGFLLF